MNNRALAVAVEGCLSLGFRSQLRRIGWCKRGQRWDHRGETMGKAKQCQQPNPGPHLEMRPLQPRNQIPCTPLQFFESFLPCRVAPTCQQFVWEIMEASVCGWEKEQTGDWLTDPCQLKTSSRHLACQLPIPVEKGHNLQIYSYNCVTLFYTLHFIWFSLCYGFWQFLKRSDMKIKRVVKSVP